MRGEGNDKMTAAIMEKRARRRMIKWVRTDGWIWRKSKLETVILPTKAWTEESFWKREREKQQ